MNFGVDLAQPEGADFAAGARFDHLDVHQS
jgi:hypothetical protein